jgi:hypothetical protein
MGILMKKTISKLVNEITERVVQNIIETKFQRNEGTGFDSIFEELKKKLKDVTMLPDNAIDASMYKEHEIVDALKSIGYAYKKPMGTKLHFFNKDTSISVYLIQKDRKITLLP